MDELASLTLAAPLPLSPLEDFIASDPFRPNLLEVLVAQGADRELAAELVALAQDWALSGLTPEAKEFALGVMGGPPIVVDLRAGLSPETRSYLTSLHPGQQIDYRRIRAAAFARLVTRTRLPRSRSNGARQHSARAACNSGDGSGDSEGGPSDGDGDSDPVAPTRRTRSLTDPTGTQPDKGRTLPYARWRL